MSRVHALLSLPDAQARDAEYWRIYHALFREGGWPPLDLEETLSVLDFLRGNVLSVREQAWLWKLLILGTCTQIVREHALACLESPEQDSYLRGLAFFYLRKHAPQHVPELSARYEQDRSPHVRYHIASSVAEPARRRALLEKILPDVEFDHELYDAIQLQLT